MNKWLRSLLTALVCVVASSCTSDRIHLVGEGSGRVGDVVIVGSTGTASWTWGSHQYKHQLKVTHNSLISLGGGDTGVLKVKLDDGTPLEFALEQGVVLCEFACDSIHMPVIWRQVNK